MHIAVSATHICYSSREVQANVYFTAWIGFGSVALNYGVWLESAGFPPLAELVNRHHRETTYNWMWTALFSLIFAGSATDIYYNRAELELRFNGETLNLDSGDWILILTLVWAEVGLCVAAVFFNEFFRQKRECPCVRKGENGNYRFVFGWRQIEGLLILISAGAKFFVILEYTGVDGVINGLSNAYFGVWGSFFNSVFCFGTWLKEKQNFEYFVRQNPEEEGAAVP